MPSEVNFPFIIRSYYIPKNLRFGKSTNYKKTTAVWLYLDRVTSPIVLWYLKNDLFQQCSSFTSNCWQNERTIIKFPDIIMYRFFHSFNSKHVRSTISAKNKSAISYKIGKNFLLEFIVITNILMHDKYLLWGLRHQNDVILKIMNQFYSLLYLYEDLKVSLYPFTSTRYKIKSPHSHWTTFID